MNIRDDVILEVEHNLQDQVLFRYLFTSKFNKKSACTLLFMNCLIDSESNQKINCMEKREWYWSYSWKWTYQESNIMLFFLNRIMIQLLRDFYIVHIKQIDMEEYLYEMRCYYSLVLFLMLDTWIYVIFYLYFHFIL